MSFLASGGSIGNELFFLISGFLFSAKEDIKKDIRIRFIRLYIPAYIMIIVTAIFGRIQIDGLVKAVRVFIWPTQFWFVGAIFLYSILLYWLINEGIENKRIFISFTFVLIILDVLLYVFAIHDKSQWIVEDAYLGFIPFRSIYSFFSFVLGYYLKKNNQWSRKNDERLIIVVAILLFISFYGFKFALNKGIVPMPMQILSQPLTVLCATFIIMSFVKVDMNPKLEGTRIGNWINSLSGLSLEAYLVQFLIIEGISKLEIIVFPVNLILCFVTVIITAVLLKKVDSYVNRLIGKQESL